MKIYIIIFIFLALSVAGYFIFRPKKTEEEKAEEQMATSTITKPVSVTNWSGTRMATSTITKPVSVTNWSGTRTLVQPMNEIQETTLKMLVNN